MKTIILGSDHAGVQLKAVLSAYLQPEYQILDVGTNSSASCHYPLLAKDLALKVLEKKCLGILICGSGLGMSMAANRIQGIRAALCTNEYLARMSREHNNANVLCLGERVIGIDLAKSIVDSFLSAEFAQGRHQIRVDLLEELAPRV